MSFDPKRLGALTGRRFLARASAADRTVGELYLYDAIGSSDFFGGISAGDVAAALDDLRGKGATSLNVFVNSPGGDVFEGNTIHNLLRRFEGKRTVFIDGLAASIASVIAMAGDRIVAAPNSMMMIHEPWGLVAGGSAELKKYAEELDKVRDVLVNVYAQRTKQTPEQIRDWLAAETWMDANEAKARGFVDEVSADGTAEPQASAGFPLLNKFRNTPEPLREQARAGDALLATMEQRLMAHRIGRASPVTRKGQPERTEAAR